MNVAWNQHASIHACQMLPGAIAEASGRPYQNPRLIVGTAPPR
ncbi:hypothetical protein THTE_3685 [Thermogutta terrifontis]|uniref:Uncharacterized protein n=1 Tax=Thermogutta terrifontis TaxID=1331910 RepID=A0A286RK12_9BACT|nr:hypothetical protein THTE_3685 [Thermogutta terrifontis]